ncbi:unnamed protein product [Brassica oleracea]|uniref:(rape) hypothetical protein n=1 Tax=Brassica napus TaxID=3708 RepID=A0A816Q8A0_BRANA|nr:unnamed protein product [Brassica napus]
MGLSSYFDYDPTNLSNGVNPNLCEPTPLMPLFVAPIFDGDYWPGTSKEDGRKDIKCYEAEQMHEDMESHICLIFKTNSTADSLHADKFVALGKSRVHLISFFPTKYGLSFGFIS